MSRTEASRNMGGHAPSAAAGVPPAFVVIIAGMVAALHIGKIPPAIPVLRDALGVSLVEAGFL
ncbi:MAG TPA: MFS transporter, partial [Thauera aminoaromatica]|nr:MFS transporter [Thauera aminoaromatica]